MAFSFFGGVHPDDHKNLARDVPIQEFPEPDVLVIPMSQHIGAPCRPLVKKGDLVTKGQKIGDNEGLCCPVHAPVSGKVKAVEVYAHSSGTSMMSVIIENDHLGTLCEDIQPRTQEQVDALTPEELTEIIHQAGIVGMGGASFPTHVKLASGMGKVDTIIVNAGECEPYITADDRLCREYPEQVISGIKIIMKIFGLSSAHIGIENNKPEAAKALQAQLCSADGITIDILPAMYPQGAEKQMIQAVTGREVPSGGLPSAVGCAVFNVASCKAIHDAVYDGMPLIRRVVTVSGTIIMEPKNLMVPIGTSFNDLMDAVGLAENPYKVLCGGPMMGITQYDLSVPTTKGTNAVTFIGHKGSYIINDPQCIRCGRCVDVCPMHLMPVLMYKAMLTGDPQQMKDVHLMDCIECGCCAYACPGCLPLVLGFRCGKQRIRDYAAAAASKKV